MKFDGKMSPQEISDLRQPVKVWLAEDFAPLQSQAFFFIISHSVVIHGVREQDDEGYEALRRTFIDPIERAHGLSLRISTAIANLFGAHG